MDEAAADLQAVSRQLAVEHPAANKGWSIALAPLHAATIGDTASVLWLLFGSVGLVLLIACGDDDAIITTPDGPDATQDGTRADSPTTADVITTDSNTKPAIRCTQAQ